MFTRLPQVFAALVLLSGFAAVAEPVLVPAKAEHWSPAGGVTFMRYLEQDAMVLSGDARVVPDVDISNGRIDVDVAMHGVRGFIGIVFRYQSSEEYELFYLRPHKTGLPDSTQYTPVINGLSAWQLYGSDKHTSTSHLPWDRWVHVTVEFSGREAKLYLDNRTTPELTVTLEHPGTSGSVGLWGGSVGHFANFRYETTGKERVLPREPFTAPAGIVTGWQLSEVYERAGANPKQVPADATWQDVALEAPGMVNISRYRAKLKRDARKDPTSNEDLVYARTTYRSTAGGLGKLWFGYSDNITILLNGVPVYEGHSGFNYRYPFALGILGLRNDAVFVNLNPGDNELVFVVSEVFGGWGFAAEMVVP